MGYTGSSLGTLKACLFFASNKKSPHNFYNQKFFVNEFQEKLYLFCSMETFILYSLRSLEKLIHMYVSLIQII